MFADFIVPMTALSVQGKTDNPGLRSEADLSQQAQKDKKGGCPLMQGKPPRLTTEISHKSSSRRARFPAGSLRSARRKKARHMSKCRQSRQDPL